MDTTVHPLEWSAKQQ